MKVSIHASAIAPEDQCFCEATCAQPRCETNAMPGRCYAPVESALARLAFSCRLLVGAYGAALPGGFNARTRGLVPSRNSARGALCYAFRSPSMPTGRSLCQECKRREPCKCAASPSFLEKLCKLFQTGINCIVFMNKVHRKTMPRGFTAD